MTISVNEAANRPPTAVASANPASGTAPLAVSFTGGTSFDDDGTVAVYAWVFGDSGSSSQPNPTHTYQNPGTYTAVLTITDNDGATDTAQVTISVDEAQNRPPTVMITAPAAGAVFSVGQPLNFAGQGEDPEDGILPASAFVWEVSVGGGPFQTYATGIKSGTAVPVAPGSFHARLTVKDSDGAIARDEVVFIVTP